MMKAIGRAARVACLALTLAACDSLPGALDEEPNLTTPGPNPGTLTVENSYHVDLVVYFSRCEESTWGGSRGVVTPNRSRSWTVEPGCYDIKAEFSGGAFRPLQGIVEPGRQLTVEFG